MEKIDLGLLENGPHAELIREMGQKCFADERIKGIWVGGSLASGTGDFYSDIDFRVAVEPGELGEWHDPEWERYLPVARSGGIFMKFGEQALLHHMVLADGTILDFYVQDTTKQNFEPNIVVLACRDAAFGEALSGFTRPPAPLIREIDGAATRRFLVDYWITTHKQMKALARKYDLSPFVGLYFERIALLRAWYMQATGTDAYARPSLHLLGALHKGLEGSISAEQAALVGMASGTPEETVAAVEATRAEMVKVGRWLADRYEFDYPHELEAVVQQAWDEHKASIITR